MECFLDGDEHALMTIFDSHVKALHNYGFKFISDSEVVKDAVQELFIELWKNRANLGETNSIKAYLFTSLRRKLFRAKGKQRNNKQIEFSQEHATEHTPSAEFVLEVEQSSIERTQRVMAMLNALSKRQREAVFLRYFEEMDYEKIASVMELSKQVVYNLVHKAIEALKSR